MASPWLKLSLLVNWAASSVSAPRHGQAVGSRRWRNQLSLSTIMMRDSLNFGSLLVQELSNIVTAQEALRTLARLRRSDNISVDFCYFFSGRISEMQMFVRLSWWGTFLQTLTGNKLGHSQCKVLTSRASPGRFGMCEIHSSPL